MKALRWNFSDQIYEPYNLPDESTCFEEDLNKFVNCASCGQEFIFGLMFTSRQIHTATGFGYAVCDMCYSKEWEEERFNRLENIELLGIGDASGAT